MATIIRALKIGSQQTFPHHRSGWAYAINSLRPLDNENGVRFEGFLDNLMFRDESIGDYFVGFFHNPLFTPSGVHQKYESRGLYNYLSGNCWKRHESLCKGIFVLSDNMKKNVSDMTDCPCESLIHPVEMCDIKFSLDKYNSHPRIIQLGQWMRRFDSFARLSCSQKKVALSFSEEHLKNGMQAIDHLCDNDFDELLSGGIVFVHFFDVAACNAILDCIARDTPIFCNRLPAAEQYLGKDYPGFFDSFKEAESLIGDEKTIQKSHEFIKNMDKSIFSESHFLKSLSESKIYKNISKKFLKAI
jgi:hypothetical protein